MSPEPSSGGGSAGDDRGRATATVRLVESTGPGDDSESDRYLGLSPRLVRRLDTRDGDAILLTAPSGTRAVGLVSRRDDGGEGIALTPAFAERIDLAAGDRVVVERADPVAATEVVLAPVAAISVRGGRDTVAETLAGRPLLVGETVEVSLLGGTLDVPCRVLDTDPSGVVRVDDDTAITLEDGPAGTVDGEYGPVPSAAVGGYESTVAACRSALVRPLAGDDVTVGGESVTTGVLVEGQAGVGKSHHVRHAAWLADAERLAVDATRLASGGYDAATDYLESVETRAIQHARALVHVEGLDALAAENGPGGRPAVGRLQRRSGVVVAGETRDAAALPDALIRGDRLGRRIEVSSPTDADRTAVFATLTRGLEFGPDLGPATVGERALGYVAADLVALRARLVEAAIERIRGDARGERSGLTLTAADFETALAGTTPTASSAASVDVPDVSFDDVGGLAAAKRELVRAVEWPLRYPGALDRLGVEPPGGVLLYGPPGTGKTLLARAVASSTDANFIAVDGPELFDKFVGESERAVREVFRQARASAPAVVFFDEVDALGATRGDEGGAAPERVVSQLLTELDGLEGREGVTVLGATNRLDRIDPALLRPGRFDRAVEVGLPDRTAREEILAVHARDRPLRGVDLSALADRTDGFSGSDLAALLREASLAAIEDRLGDSRTPEDVSGFDIRPRHVEAALSRVDPSVSPAADRATDGDPSQ